MLNLQELDVFLVAAELGNFSEAGRVLSLSQPAVSQTIANLEKRLGVQLFVRHGRSVSLSDAGETLVPLARELLETAKRLEEMMSSLHGTVAGNIMVGCSTSSGKYLLPGLIARFRDQFPKVRVDVLVTNQTTVAEKLVEGHYTFGVTSKQVEHRDLDYEPFFVDDVVLIVQPGHAWTRLKEIEPEALLEVPMILREEGSGTYEVLSRGLLERGISRDMLNIAMVLGNADAIEAAVGEGLGVAFIPRMVAARGLRLGHVVEINVRDMTLQHTIYLVRNHRLPCTRSHQEFWDFIQDSRSMLMETYARSITPKSR